MDGLEELGVSHPNPFHPLDRLLNRQNRSFDEASENVNPRSSAHKSGIHCPTVYAFHIATAREELNVDGL